MLTSLRELEELWINYFLPTNYKDSPGMELPQFIFWGGNAKKDYLQKTHSGAPPNSSLLWVFVKSLTNRTAIRGKTCLSSYITRLFRDAVGIPNAVLITNRTELVEWRYLILFRRIGSYYRQLTIRLSPYFHFGQSNHPHEMNLFIALMGHTW